MNCLGSDHDTVPSGSAVTSLKVLVTAEEAYPELERLFLNAKESVIASFRVFDLDTRLHSPEARAIGETWFDLIEHALRRGVLIRMALSDFDAVVGTDLHHGSWHSARQFYAAAELAGPDARLDLRLSLHAAQAGTLARLFLWPATHGKLRARFRELAEMEPDKCATYWRDIPALHMFGELSGGKPRRHGIGPFPISPATHHQKLAVIDRRQLYIGGLDLNERRYDTKQHARSPSETWHDVQILVEGDVVQDALRHLETFESVVAGCRAPEPSRSDAFLRTLSRRRRFGPTSIAPVNVCNDFAREHRRRALSSRRLIYMETQYFRDRRLTRRLMQAGQNNPDLRMILVLPAAPEEIAFNPDFGLDARFGEYLQTRSLRQLQAVFGPRLFIGSPVQRRRQHDGGDRRTLGHAPIVYVHAKVSIFDDDAAIVSSANLNGRSMRWDTEAGVLLRRPEFVRHLRERLFSHWWPDEPLGSDMFDPVKAQQVWAHHALANVNVTPETRRGFIVPYDMKPAEDASQMVPGAPEDIV